MDGLLVREIESADAEEAAALSAELGYPVAVEIMAARIGTLTHRTDHVVYVACLQSRVIGWIDVGIVHHLQAEPYGEIGGLIVSVNQQSRGVGSVLVEKAEHWIAGKGLATVLVRSQIAREAAHQFYLRRDYVRVKTSAVFTKSVGRR